MGGAAPAGDDPRRGRGAARTDHCQRSIRRCRSGTGRATRRSCWSAARIADTRDDLWIVPPTDGAAAQPYVTTAFNQTFGVFSPDGRSIAYASDESGQFDIYVDTFPKPGTRIADHDRRRAPSRDGAGTESCSFAADRRFTMLSWDQVTLFNIAARRSRSPA